MTYSKVEFNPDHHSIRLPKLVNTIDVDVIETANPIKLEPFVSLF